MKRHLLERWLVVGFFCLGLLPRVWALEEPPKEMPPDMPVTSSVIHNLKYSYAKSLQLELGAGYLYGDKFLTGFSKGISGYYYVSEQFAFGSEVFLTSNSMDSEGKLLVDRGVNALMHNPSLSIRAAMLWQPIYGKFAIGSHIQHFFWNFGLGFHGAQEEVVTPGSESFISGSTVPPGTKKWRFGPSLSTKLIFPISDIFLVSANFQYFLHGSMDESENSSLRHLWFAGLGAGLRW